MNLKNAIREAVDERDKQENNGPDTASSQPTSLEAPTEPKQQSIKAVNAASSKAVNTAFDGESEENRDSENGSTPNGDDKETTIELAALTIRVPRQSRIHWLVSAKQQNTTLTAAITEALNSRFGNAVNQ